MNKFYMVIGDWSKDGHNQSDNILVESNYTVKEMQDAYKASCKLTGISFHSNSGDRNNFTGLKRDWEEEDKYCVCVQYEDNEVSPEVMEVFKKFNAPFIDKIKENEGWAGIDAITKMIMWFISLSMPKDFEYKFIDEEIPYLNGFWNKNLNVQFGYGLYIGYGLYN